jgi:hypothetical protein
MEINSPNPKIVALRSVNSLVVGVNYWGIDEKKL